MKRKIIVTIETSECGRYCGEDCTFYFYSEGHAYREDYWICGMNVKGEWIELVQDDNDETLRCEACLAAEKEVGR